MGPQWKSASFPERDNEIIDVEATIYCEKASHKGIIIGKQGAMMKKISTSARRDMERFMGTKVFFNHLGQGEGELRDNLAAIQNFGYSDQ